MNKRKQLDRLPIDARHLHELMRRLFPKANDFRIRPGAREGKRRGRSASEAGVRRRLLSSNESCRRRGTADDRRRPTKADRKSKTETKQPAKSHSTQQGKTLESTISKTSNTDGATGATVHSCPDSMRRSWIGHGDGRKPSRPRGATPDTPKREAGGSGPTSNV